jgi:hypothetical protein
MESIVGIVDTVARARQVAAEVLREVPGVRIRILTPDSTPRDLANVPTDEAEQPGMGSAIGAVAGGATGAAAASLLVPPAGAIAIAGIAAAALFGGLAGMATGHKIEDAGSYGLSRDELFLYANALRNGRCVVIAWVDDDDEAERVRRVMAAANVESIDAAREVWWVGLRDAEAAAYGDGFSAHETPYRQGFEAACRGEAVASAPSDLARHPAFRAGHARGRAWVEEHARELAVTRPRTVPDAPGTPEHPAS